MKIGFLSAFIIVAHLNLHGQEIKILTATGELTFPDDFAEQGPELNQDFPDFNYVDINGDTLNFIQLKNKVVIINVWFVGCRGCKQEEPNLKKLRSAFKNNEKFEFISFCMSSPNKIKKYFAKHGEFGYRTVSVDSKEVETRYLTVTSPTHFIIEEGKLIKKFTMPIVAETTFDWFLNELHRLE